MAVAITLSGLGLLLQAKGDYPGAEPLLREALAIRRKRLDAKDPALAKSLKDLGLLLKATGNHTEAGQLFREASDIDRPRGPESRSTTGPVP